MRVSWHSFEARGRRAEAQLWAPDAGSRRLILFCPGFPGVGATLFEQRHAATLVQAGYEIAVLRHAGTRLDSPSAPLMINNALRLSQARAAGETLLGGGPSCVADWLYEPLTALEALAPRYQHIVVIGNSFGALSCLWSLTEEGAPVAAVRHILLMAGAQGACADGGKTDVMRIWRPEFVGHPLVTGKVALEDPQVLVETMGRVYRDLPGRAAGLPAGIGLTYLVVAQDELLRLSDTEAFRAALGGRGTVVIDDIDRAYPDHHLMAHEMPDYPTEMLAALFD